jgi:glycosyltransferase involved in cell wall biosynthesis
VPSRPWTRWLYNPARLDGLVLLSEGIAEHAQRDLGLDRRRLRVAPGGVDTERFAPRTASHALREELGIKPGDRVIGVVARLQPRRRFDLLLEAFQRAVQETPELRLLVVGRGTRASQVMDEPIRRLGLGDAVVRAGYRRDDYVDTLALMDALCFLVPGSDGSCRAVLEAMAMGVPTIATRRGLLPEIVADGETGCLVDETPESLAAAFVDAGRQASDWRARGEAARRRAVERHPVERLAAELDSLYRLAG